MNNPQPSIELVVEEPTGRTRSNWPITCGIPFPQGVLFSTARIFLHDADGKSLPLQTQSLATWPDGSIKWVLIDFQANLPGQTLNRFYLDYNHPDWPPSVPGSALISARDGSFIIDTGPLQASLSVTNGWGIIDQVTLNGKLSLLDNPSNVGVVITSDQGDEFSTRLGKVSLAVLEVDGPLRSVIHLVGDHRDQKSQKLFSYEARLTVHANQPWIDVEYTFINDSEIESIGLEKISFNLNPEINDSPIGLTGAYQDLYESEKSFSIYTNKPAVFNAFSGTRIYDENNQHVDVPAPGEMLLKVAHGWADLSGPQGGVTVALHRAGQMAPKRLTISNGSIGVDLWPSQAGPLTWHQGWARTHRFLIFFHTGTGKAACVNEVSTCYEDDLRLWIPDWCAKTEALGPLMPYFPEKYPGLNSKLRSQLSAFLFSNRSLGLVDYGDHPQMAGGARANYMSNNEYDLPHVMALQFARTGEREYFEVMESAAWHMMDIDLIHYSSRNSLEIGGVRIHGDNHIQYNCEGAPNFSLATSHMWTEGLLEYYFYTGHPRALESARRIGDCLLRLLEAGWGVPPYKVPWHSARDTGWPLIALTALYEATGEQKWLDGCHAFAKALLDEQNSDGTWDLWLGWYNGKYVPLQLGIGITGLARYHQVTGDERTRKGLLKASQAFLEKCSFPEGMLWYINAPGYRWNYACGVIIESLGYVWKLTGDLRYLKLGWNSFKVEMASTSPTGTSLADSWRGLLRYMYWTDQAGFLTDF